MLVVERREPVHQALHRALVLARHFHASLELVLYEGEAADVPVTHETRRDGLRAGKAYLESLCGSITDPGVPILLDVVTGGTLHEAVVHAVLNRCPDLVVRAAHAHGAAAREFLRADMLLVRACPAPVLLTSGRAWHPRPRLAAFVDIFDRRGPAATRAVAAMGACLRQACGGDLEIICSAPQVDGSPVDEADARGSGDEETGRLAELLQQCDPGPSALSRIPESSSLAQLVERQGVDLLVHAVPDPLPARRASLLSPDRALAALECDVLFVRPGRYRRYDQTMS